MKLEKEERAELTRGGEGRKREEGKELNQLQDRKEEYGKGEGRSREEREEERRKRKKLQRKRGVERGNFGITQSRSAKGTEMSERSKREQKNGGREDRGKRGKQRVKICRERKQ